MSARSFRIESSVRGHHIYKDLWTPTIGEELQTVQELDNHHDPFAVAVVKEGVTVGHIPRDISRVCWYFLERHNTITCRITDKRQYSSFRGKGLEVPCIIMFTGKPTHVDKLIRTFFIEDSS